MASGPTWNAQRRTWYVQYWMDGTWHRKTVGKAPKLKPGASDPDNGPSPPPEAKAALAHWTHIEEEARKHGASGIPVGLKEFLDRHVERYDNAETKLNVRITFDQFLEWCTKKGLIRFNQIDTDVCEDWVEHVAQSLAINTVIRKRAQLSSAWGVLKKKKRILENPWTGVKARGQQRTKPRKAWSKVQFEKIVAVSNPWLQDVLTIGVNTGLRIGALMGLEWKDWLRPETSEDLYGKIEVRKELDKAKRGYKVPVSKALHDVLKRRYEDPNRHPQYIVTGRMGGKLCDRNVTRRAICTACAIAGLEKPQSPNHHMRRTFGRWAHFGYLTGNPIPIYVISKWLGHSNIKTTLIYLDLDEEDSGKFMVPDKDKPQ